MRRYVQILHDHDLRFIVLAVVLGHAIASGIGAAISFSLNSIGLTVQAAQYGFAKSVRLGVVTSFVTGPANILLWAAVAFGTLLLLDRLMNERRES